MNSRVLASLHSALGRRVALTDDWQSFTYSELRAAVDAESRWLMRSAVSSCALLADNGASWAIADLSLLQSRALHVPLPVWFTEDQIDHVLDDAGLEFVLTDQPRRFLDRCDRLRVCGIAPRSQLTLLRRQTSLAPRMQADVVKVTYTSGSTGAPKGVCLTVEALESVARSVACATSLRIGRHLCAMPLATLLENVAGVYGSILLEATCAVPSSRTMGMDYGSVDAAAFVAAISRESPHSLIVPPELLRLLVAATRKGWRPPADLRFIAVGGATVSQALLDEAMTLGLPAYQGYGLSECASVVCLNTPGAQRAHSVGKPLPHARVRIDEHGQIVVGGAVMRGYLGLQAAAPAEIETGDLGEIDADGYLFVRGRLKNMFITSMGRNVSPEWVEAELMRELSIGQAVVSGEGRPWPCALIWPSSQTITIQDIERAVSCANERLPNYAQVRRWARLPQPLGFAGGTLTANGRPRRDVIARDYGALVEDLYAVELAS
ncbi:MAG TPA: AMP-binding protein [Steroidobacteraceae bacterium]|nr:AMP-binding protein [Steroidobacteraceae bacterium]